MPARRKRNEMQNDRKLTILPDPKKMRFLMTSPESMNQLEQILYGTQVVWPHHHTHPLTLHCMFPQHDWSNTVIDTLDAFLDTFFVKIIDVPADIWPGVVTEVQSMHIKHKTSVQVQVEETDRQIFVVGYPYYAEVLYYKVTHIMTSQTAVRDVNVPVKRPHMELFLRSKGAIEKISKKFGVKIVLCHDTMQFKITGIQKKVMEAKRQLHETIANIHTRCIHISSQRKHRFLQNSEVSGYIDEKVKKKCSSATWELTHDNIIVYAFKENDVKMAVEILSWTIIEFKTEVDPELSKLLSSDAWKTEVEQMKSFLKLPVEVQHDEEAKQLVLISTDLDADCFQHIVLAFISANVIQSRELEIPADILKRIQQDNSNDIDRITEQLQNEKVKAEFGKTSIKVTGTDLGIKQVTTCLHQFIDDVTEKLRKLMNTSGVRHIERSNVETDVASRETDDEQANQTRILPIVIRWQTTEQNESQWRTSKKELKLESQVHLERWCFMLKNPNLKDSLTRTIDEIKTTAVFDEDFCILKLKCKNVVSEEEFEHWYKECIYLLAGFLCNVSLYTIVTKAPGKIETIKRNMKGFPSVQSGKIAVFSGNTQNEIAMIGLVDDSRDVLFKLLKIVTDGKICDVIRSEEIVSQEIPLSQEHVRLIKKFDCVPKLEEIDAERRLRIELDETLKELNVLGDTVQISNVRDVLQSNNWLSNFVNYECIIVDKHIGHLLRRKRVVEFIEDVVCEKLNQEIFDWKLGRGGTHVNIYGLTASTVETVARILQTSVRSRCILTSRPEYWQEIIELRLCEHYKDYIEVLYPPSSGQEIQFYATDIVFRSRDFSELEAEMTKSPFLPGNVRAVTFPPDQYKVIQDCKEAVIQYSKDHSVQIYGSCYNKENTLLIVGPNKLEVERAEDFLKEMKEADYKAAQIPKRKKTPKMRGLRK